MSVEIVRIYQGEPIPLTVGPGERAEVSLNWEEGLPFYRLVLIDQQGQAKKTVEVRLPSSAIETEPSPTPKYLRLASGAVEVYSSVYISVDGNWLELTQDTLPEDG